MLLLFRSYGVNNPHRQPRKGEEIPLSMLEARLLTSVSIKHNQPHNRPIVSKWNKHLSFSRERFNAMRHVFCGRSAGWIDTHRECWANSLSWELKLFSSLSSILVFYGNMFTCKYTLHLCLPFAYIDTHTHTYTHTHTHTHIYIRMTYDCI